MAKNDITPCNVQPIDNNYGASANETNDASTTESLTIVEALDNILECVEDSGMDHEIIRFHQDAFDYLYKQLNLTKIQCVVVALLSDRGASLSWRDMAKYVGVSRLNFMRYYDEVEELVSRRWLQHYRTPDSEAEDGTSEGYHLMPGVVTALRKNKPFVPEKLECKTTKQFIERMAEHIKRGQRNSRLSYSDDIQWVKALIMANQQLGVAQFFDHLAHDEYALGLLVLLLSDYVYYGGTDQEGVCSDTIEGCVFDEFDPDCPEFFIEELECGGHFLMKCGVIEHKFENGFANTSVFVLSDEFKHETLEDYVPKPKKKSGNTFIPEMAGLMPFKKIKEKQLFYNANEHVQISRLATLLSKEQFPLVQQRLESKGMRKGFACLLYGGPGTGKTATAYELARQTGRDIICVSVTQFKDKFVGESEKKLREIFMQYRMLCENKRITPILLMNEADSIISTRMENISQSVDQMNNSLQNILLEELESLNGILIATTNLTNNMDAAFERRFLFKIEFHKPDVDTRVKIWTSMIPELTAENALRLSRKYDFSGGEMENISRKATVEYIINGTEPTYEQIDHFCSQERLAHRKTMTPVIGFAV